MRKTSMAAGMAAAIIFTGALPAGAETGCEETAAQVGHGEVKQIGSAYYAQGTGVPNLKDPNMPKEQILRMTEKAAEADAVRKVVEQVKGALVGPGKTGDNAMTMKVMGAIKGFKRCKTKYFADGGVDMVIMVPIEGSLAELLKTATAQAPAPATPPAEQPKEAPKTP